MLNAMLKSLMSLLMVASLTNAASADDSENLRISLVFDDLIEPWALEILPNGALLVTERDGLLIYVTGASANQVQGVPKVVAEGQGGLLDVMLPRDFAQSREVFLSYVKKQSGRDMGTALAVGKLSRDGRRLTGTRDIFVMSEGTSTGRHFGSRIVEGIDGTIFLTIGDRGTRDQAQDLSNHAGTVVRVNRDGTVPANNPFVGVEGALPEIYSYGHRNAQGATLAPDGSLYVVEHGARGGDEINLVRKGRNYGWPVISYGRHYTGSKIGEGTAKDGMEQPELYWDPSIAPSGMMVYRGNLFSEWKHDFFVGSLKLNYIARIDGATMKEVGQIDLPETARVRDIAEGADGSIYFISVGRGSIYKIEPASL